MRFGIIGAMEQEIRLLKEQLNQTQVHHWHTLEFIEGKLHNHDLVLVRSGIGKVNAALTTTYLIDHFGIDKVINTGSAGAIDPGLEVGDLVLAYSLTHHDVDVTAFGYAWGQMSGMPEVFYADSALLRLAQATYREMGMEPVIGQVVSGDQFIHSTSVRAAIREKFPLARACEMESAAIAQVCYQLEVPFLIIRAISDQADGHADVSFDRFIDHAGQVAATLVEKVLAAHPE